MLKKIHQTGDDGGGVIARGLPTPKRSEATVVTGALPRTMLQPSGSKLETWSFWIALIGVSALAAGLRLYQIGSPSLQVDEFFTIARCGQEEVSILQFLGYVPSKLSLLWSGADLSRIDLGNIASWQQLGVTETAARLGPAIVGIITIPLVALLSRRSLGNRGAVYLALLLAISPWHLYWSQSARFYSTQFLLFSTGFCLLCSALHARSTWRAVPAFGLMALAHLAQPITVLMLGGMGVVLLIASLIRREDRFLRQILYFAIATIVLGAVLIGVPLLQEPMSHTPFSEQTWGVDAVTMILGTIRRIGLPIVVLGVLMFASHVARRKYDEHSMRSWMCISVGVIPIVLLFLLDAQFPIAQRYIFCSLIGWLILAVMGILVCEQALRNSSNRIMACALLLCVSVSVGWHTWGYVWDGLGWRWPWRQAFTYVAQHRVSVETLQTDHPFQGMYYLEDQIVTPIVKTADRSFWQVTRANSSSTSPIVGHVGDLSRDFFLPSRPWQPPIRAIRFTGHVAGSPSRVQANPDGNEQMSALEPGGTDS